MKKIDFLRTVAAVSLAVLVHIVALYGAAAATPWPQHRAVILVGPVVAVGEVVTTRVAAKAAHANEG
jgi:hypothetical protein